MMANVPTIEQIQQITDPRQRLLAAGARVVLDDGLAALANGVSPDRVTRVAGRSRRIFYDHFATKEDFLGEVVSHYLEPDGFAELARSSSTEIANLVWSTQGDLVASARTLCETSFERGVGSDADRFRALITALSVSGPMGEMVQHRLDRTEEAIGEFVTTLHEQWGLELRPPWTARRIACAVHALADGLMLRARAGVDVADGELFSLAVLSMLPMATQRSVDARTTVTERLESFNHQLVATWRERTLPEEAPNTRERVVDAFLGALADHGPRDTSVARVSELSGVSEAAIIGAFGSIEGLLSAALQDSTPSLQAEAEFDLTSDAITVEEAVRRHLVRVGTWVVDQPLLANAVMAFGLAGPGGRSTDVALEFLWSLSAPLATILREGRDRGDVRSDAELTDTAIMASEVLLGRGGTMPAFDLDGQVGFLTNLIMRGLANRA